MNTVIQLAGKVGSTVTGIIVISLMTRWLGAEGFGAYSAANAFLQIFALILDVGINVTFPAMLGEHAHDEAYQKRLFTAILTLRLLMSAVILLLLAPLVAFIWPFPWEVKTAIFALSLSFVFPNLQQILTGVQQQRLRMGMAIINIAGLLLAPLFGWGLMAQCWIISLSSFTVFAMNALSVRRFLPLEWNWDTKIWWMTLKRSWPVGLSIGLNLIYYRADTLVLQHYRPEAEVGWYGAAYRILDVLVTVPFLYAGILLPILSKTWRDRRLKDLTQMVSRSLDVMILITLPLIVGMYWFGERALVLISGPEFLSAGTLAKVLIFAVTSIYFNTILSYTIIALQAQRKMLPVYAFTAFGTLAGYLLLIPLYGSMAAAWLTVASETTVLLGAIVTVRRYIKFSPSIRLLFGAIASAAAMWVAGSYTTTTPIYAGVIICGIVYVIFLVGTRTMTPASIQTLFTVQDPGSPISLDVN